MIFISTTKLVIFCEWCSFQAIAVNAGSSPATIPNHSQLNMEKTIDYELKHGEMTALIRGMEVGDVLRFPITKHNSVRNTTSNNLLVERAEGHKWSVNADIPNKQSVVTRIE